MIVVGGLHTHVGLVERVCHATGNYYNAQASTHASTHAIKQAGKQANTQASMPVGWQASHQACEQASKQAVMHGSTPICKHACKQASAQASEQASKRAHEHGSKHASKYARTQASKHTHYVVKATPGSDMWPVRTTSVCTHRMLSLRYNFINKVGTRVFVVVYTQCGF